MNHENPDLTLPTAEYRRRQDARQEQAGRLERRESLAGNARVVAFLAIVVNAHFEDQLLDGRLSFDYRLRPGVVAKGNGLVLMRLLGFEV